MPPEAARQFRDVLYQGKQPADSGGQQACRRRFLTLLDEAR
jgi:hypothetical protein